MPRHLLTYICCTFCVLVSQAQGGYIAELHRAQELFQREHFAEALTRYELAECDTSQMNAWQKRALYAPMAQCYRSLGNFPAAITCYDRLEHIGYNAAKLAFARSNLFLQMGQYEAAKRYLVGFSFDDPELERERLINLSTVFAYEGKTMDAITLLLKVRHDPRFSTQTKGYITLLNNLGYLDQQEGNHTEAVKWLQTALTCHRSASLARCHLLGNLAISEANVGQIDSATVHITAAMEWVRKELGEDSREYTILLRKQAEILLATQCNKDAADVFIEFFEREKAYILKVFPTLTPRERQNYWRME